MNIMTILGTILIGFASYFVYKVRRPIKRFLYGMTYNGKIEQRKISSERFKQRQSEIIKNTWNEKRKSA